MLQKSLTRTVPDARLNTVEPLIVTLISCDAFEYHGDDVLSSHAINDQLIDDVLSFVLVPVSVTFKAMCTDAATPL